MVGAVGGAHFGDGNLPAGCTPDVAPASSPPHFTDGCYHMRTGLNDLDTPIIDVLLVAPASPHFERDVRVMRQAVESWDGGIHHLAPQVGLEWLDAVEFRIFVDDDKITSDPAWDPEIVVVMANPVLAGVQGIGIDPLGFSAPCRGANPLASLDAWNALPGFDNHHGTSGTYVEECEGGGTTCYAVNLAIDPTAGLMRGLSGTDTYGLIQHEFGHCLTLGHVGDAGDHTAATVPRHDIMAYTVTDHHKCVSSLDVEAFALRMSLFLLPTPLVANDATGVDGAFQVQRPEEHFYASSTGLPQDCPVPDVGLVPLGEPTDFTPEGDGRTPPALRVTSHADGDAVAAGPITISGEVAYAVDPAIDADGDAVADAQDNCVDDANRDQRDRDHDGLGDACDADDGGLPIPDGSISGNIVAFEANTGLGATNLAQTVHNEMGDRRTKFLPGMEIILTSRSTTSEAGLVTIGVSKFTWTLWNSAGDVVHTDVCTTRTDTTGFQCDITFALPTEPGTYYASANLQDTQRWIFHDDGWLLQARAPPSRFAGLKAFEVLGAPELALAAPEVPELSQHAQTVSFEDAGDPKNTFFPQDTAAGVRPTVRLKPVDPTEYFSFRLTEPAYLKIRLAWTDGGLLNDLDLHIEGAVFVDELGGASSAEVVLPEAAPGIYRLAVEPFLITATDGVVYTLTVDVLSPEDVDDDGDGVSNADDLCPGTSPGTPVDADGCAIAPPTTERVVVRVDGVVTASQEVDGRGGDAFALPIDLTGRSGPVQVTVSWYDGARLVDEEVLTLDAQA